MIKNRRFKGAAEEIRLQEEKIARGIQYWQNQKKRVEIGSPAAMLDYLKADLQWQRERPYWSEERATIMAATQKLIAMLEEKVDEPLPIPTT